MSTMSESARKLLARAGFDPVAVEAETGPLTVVEVRRYVAEHRVASEPNPEPNPEPEPAQARPEPTEPPPPPPTEDACPPCEWRCPDPPPNVRAAVERAVARCGAQPIVRAWYVTGRGRFVSFLAGGRERVAVLP